MANNSNILLITGANTGIGYEAVKALLQSQQEYTILLGSRSTDKGEAAIAQLKHDFPETKSRVELVQIDISDDDSIHKAAAHVEAQYGRLDVLVNNAGASLDNTLEQDALNARDLFNKTYDTNVAGTQVTTLAFVPLLLKSASPRLLFLTSGLSTLDVSSRDYLPKNPAGIPAGWPKTGPGGVRTLVAYRASKAALNMVMVQWYWVLRPDAVRVWSISPGFLATGLGGIGKERMETMGAGPASLGGDLIKRVVEGERDEHIGKVVAQNGVVQPW